jgi:hypothetical protein
MPVLRTYQVESEPIVAFTPLILALCSNRATRPAWTVIDSLALPVGISIAH